MKNNHSQIQTNKRTLIRNISLHTLDEVDEHLQVSDLGFELLHQLFFDSGWIHYLSNGGIDSLPQLLGRQIPNVLVQVHIQLFDQLINDNLKVKRRVNSWLFMLHYDHQITHHCVCPYKSLNNQLCNYKLIYLESFFIYLEDKKKEKQLHTNTMEPEAFSRTDVCLVTLDVKEANTT